MLAASGANEPAYPTEIHVTAGGKRGEESIDCGSPDVIDKETFKNFVTDLSDDLKQNFDIGIDFQRYHDAGKNNQDLFTKKNSERQQHQQRFDTRCLVSFLLEYATNAHRKTHCPSNKPRNITYCRYADFRRAKTQRHCIQQLQTIKGKTMILITIDNFEIILLCVIAILLLMVSACQTFTN